MRKKEPRENFTYDDAAVNEVHNQIADAYSSGVVGAQNSFYAYQPTDDENEHTPDQ